MKVDYFYGTINIKTDKNGYYQNLNFSTDNDTKELSFSYPYGLITPDEAAAINTFVKTISDAYAKLNKQIDNANRDLKLEEYAPIEESEEAKGIEAAKLSAQQELESLAPQSAEPPVGTTDSESIEVTDSGVECEIQDVEME